MNTTVTHQSPEDPLPFHRHDPGIPTDRAWVDRFHERHRVKGLEPSPREWLIEQGIDSERVTDLAYFMMQKVYRFITETEETDDEKRLDAHTLAALASDKEKEYARNYYNSIKRHEPPLSEEGEIIQHELHEAAQPLIRPLTPEEVALVGSALSMIGRFEDMKKTPPQSTTSE